MQETSNTNDKKRDIIFFILFPRSKFPGPPPVIRRWFLRESRLLQKLCHNSGCIVHIHSSITVYIRFQELVHGNDVEAGVHLGLGILAWEGKETEEPLEKSQIGF